MLKIVKGIGPFYQYEMGDPVKISNTIHIPSDDAEEESGEFISAEELERQAAEEKAEQERRFNEAVNAEVTRIISARADAIDAERVKIIEQAQKLAADMASEAKATTLAVMEKAEKECLLIKEQARKEGYDEGFGQGREESLEKYKKYIDAAGKLLAEINSRKDAYYISNEEEMRKTAFEVTEKIVMAEVKNDPEVIDNIIAEAAKNFRNSDYVKVTLAEDGLTERFRTDENLMKEIIPFIPEIEIEFDSEAEEGTVILDNGSEIIDAGIPTQLEFLQEIMKNTRGERDDAVYTDDMGAAGEKDNTIATAAVDSTGAAAADNTGAAGDNTGAADVRDNTGAAEDAAGKDGMNAGDSIGENGVKAAAGMNELPGNDEPAVKQTKSRRTAKSKKTTADEFE